MVKLQDKKQEPVPTVEDLADQLEQIMSDHHFGVTVRVRQERFIRDLLRAARMASK